MSDRASVMKSFRRSLDDASVMKSFGRSLDEERQRILQTDEDLQLLYCIAHFLLGLGTACHTVLMKMEKEGGQRLGRDRLTKFQSYKNSSESAISRQVQIFSLFRFLNHT